MKSRVSALVIIAFAVGFSVLAGPQPARAACADDVAAAEKQAKQLTNEKEKKKAMEDLKAAKAAAAKNDEADCTAKLSEAMKKINKE